MDKLKKRIHKLKKLELLIKRRLYPLFHSTHPLFRKKNYFLNLFTEKSLGYNLEALNFDQGVVLGSFEDKNYLMHCQPGDLIETTIYLEKTWEEHLTKVMSLYLDGSSGIMIDVGANIGANTIPLAVKHPQIKFYSYEPHPEIFARFKSNIKLNKLQNVKPANCAISNSTEKSLKFFAQKNAENMGRSSLKLNSDIKEHNEIVVPVISIDNSFADSSDPILLIKIDTQGTEPEVLKSATRTIEKFRPVILFEFEDRYYADSERDQVKKSLIEFFDSSNYCLFNVSKGLDFYPAVDLTKNYHGDILATPR